MLETFRMATEVRAVRVRRQMAPLDGQHERDADEHHDAANQICHARTLAQPYRSVCPLAIGAV